MFVVRNLGLTQRQLQRLVGGYQLFQRLQVHLARGSWGEGGRVLWEHLGGVAVDRYVMAGCMLHVPAFHRDRGCDGRVGVGSNCNHQQGSSFLLTHTLPGLEDYAG